MGFSHEFVFAGMITVFIAGLGMIARSKETTKAEKLRKLTVRLWDCTDENNYDLFLFSTHFIFRRKTGNERPKFFPFYTKS